jgi:uncharacterized PurR-regulated membrane protein YhhQ (DUF165 family)
MMAGQYVFKLILAALDTPFFYLLTHEWKGETQAQEWNAGCEHREA